MQFRRLASVMSSVMLVVSVEALAEAPLTRTAEQIASTLCAACHAPGTGRMVPCDFAR